jgi:hypothetical protein
VFLKQGFEFAQRHLARYRFDFAAHVLTDGAIEEAVHRIAGSNARLHVFVLFLAVLPVNART